MTYVWRVRQYLMVKGYPTNIQKYMSTKSLGQDWQCMALVVSTTNESTKRYKHRDTHTFVFSDPTVAAGSWTSHPTTRLMNQTFQAWRDWMVPKFRSWSPAFRSSCTSWCFRSICFCSSFSWSIALSLRLQWILKSFNVILASRRALVMSTRFGPFHMSWRHFGTLNVRCCT